MTNDYPLVTIAIPTYNRADTYLKGAIQCALDQTYSAIEILISDNCSTDHTEFLVKAFKDSRIRYVKHKNNIGANNNFNYCVKNAKGDYFLLLHDDDLIDKDFIEVCMNTIKGNPNAVGIIRTGTRVIDAQGNIVDEYTNLSGGLTTEEFFRLWFSWKTALYLCSTLFNTKKLIEIGGFHSKHNLFQDVVAELKLAAKYGRIDIQDIKSSFRVHSSEYTFSSKVRDWCEDSLFLLDLICDLIPNKKEIMRKEGLRYFSTFNHELVKKIESPLNRFFTYFTLIKTFKWVFLWQIFITLLRASPIYQHLRLIKRKIRQLIEKLHNDKG